MQNSASIRRVLQALWRHVPMRRKTQLAALLVLMIMAAFAEIISLGAVLPFLQALAAPESVFTSTSFSWLPKLLGVTSPAYLVHALTLLFCGAALAAGAVRLVLLLVSNRMSHGIAHDLAVAAYGRILHQPYEVHARLNSSHVIATIGKTRVANMAIMAVLKMLSSVILLASVAVALILLLDGAIALGAVAMCAALYVSAMALVRRRLQKSGSQLSHNLARCQQIVQEGLGGIRDVLLTGSQAAYSQRFQRAEATVSKSNSTISFLAQCPRYVIETLGMILIALVAYVISFQPGGIVGALPMLAALALASQRLFPAMQQLFGGWALLRGKQASLLKLVGILDMPEAGDRLLRFTKPVAFERDVRFDNVSFRYQGTSTDTLKNCAFTISKGSKVALIGPTGSGKTTALDILMGLLEPSSGQVLIDGQPLTRENVGAWQANLAHVSQDIFLSDASLAENIAFGVPAKFIDKGRVREVARQAQVADFIEELPRKYETEAGERGVRLSGGQRQRIAIARALYRKASILVLDEATSALDNETESAVMNVIDGLGESTTVLLVAHRLTTVRGVDQVFVLNHGRVMASGTYDAVIGADGNVRLLKAI